MRYSNPPGSSPVGLNHAEVPVVDWPIGIELLSGHDEINLDEFARRSRYAWAEHQRQPTPRWSAWRWPTWERAAATDRARTRTAGNPKYGAGVDLLCSEFVSWYYHEAGVEVNGSSVRDIIGTQQLHDLFEAEGTLYRYNSGTNLQSFVHADTEQRCTHRNRATIWSATDLTAPSTRSSCTDGCPGNPAAAATNDRYNRAVVINGPWPVTLRLVHIHQDELNDGKDFWLGRID